MTWRLTIARLPRQSQDVPLKPMLLPLWILRYLLLLCAVHWVQEGLGCYKCFVSNKERVEICDYVFMKQRLDVEICSRIMKKTFLPLDTYVIAMSQKEIVRQAMNGFYDEVKKQYTQGVQEKARKFNCLNCEEESCNLPIECPIEDVYVHEFQRVVMNCSTDFPLPVDDITVRWKFYWNDRTRRWSHFTALHKGVELFFLITRMVLEKQGTYACEISTDEDVLIRKYFFINVTSSSLYESMKHMQELFERIVQPTTPKPARVGLRNLFVFRDLLNPKKPLPVAKYILYTAIVSTITVLLVLIVGIPCYFIYK
ncbi:sperm acrosome membrane-associated protein 6 isoform X5 [Xenopus laevis]|uniref:Sperm acrosome membrane-associated protein 6 isoform X5 n=1 Tax=Xenopus laevis TaxID=8355 RepID=A0A8J1L9H4_XENLA|nr:sperm acrosome membrane-associated protein 6 isoform X5 [Xenopus laevis]